MFLKRIPDKLKTDIEQFRSAPSGNNVLFFSADSGMGKPMRRYLTVPRIRIAFTFLFGTSALSLHLKPL